jgi:hypothetical protein
MTDHAPVEQITHTVSVICTSTGPLVTGVEDPWPATVLADVEAFCYALRKRGAKDDLVIGGARELSAVLDLGGGR